MLRPWPLLLREGDGELDAGFHEEVCLGQDLDRREVSVGLNGDPVKNLPAIEGIGTFGIAKVDAEQPARQQPTSQSAKSQPAGARLDRQPEQQLAKPALAKVD